MSEPWEHIHRAADKQRPSLTRAVRAALSELHDVDWRWLTGVVQQGASLREVWAVFEAPRTRAGEALAKEASRLIGQVVQDAYEGEERRLPKRFVEGFDLVNPEMVAFVEGYGFELVTAIDAVTREALRELLVRAAIGELTVPRLAKLIGESIGLTPNQTVAMQNVERDAFERALKDGKSVTQAYEIAGKAAERYRKAAIRTRAEAIARTETLRAANAGQQALWNQAIRDGLLPDTALKVWIVTPDDRLCKRCRPLGGLEAPVAEPFNTPEGEIEHPPLHPRCLPGDSRVLAAGISAASQRWYDGDLVVIDSASGNKLACTPNHPILTPSGWVAAGELHEGGYVISRAFNERAGDGGLDDDDVPALIQDVAEAFGRSEHVTARPVPVAAEDFHGDGAGSKVAVVWANRLLWDRLDSALAQPRSKLNLGWGRVKGATLNSLGMLNLRLQWNGAPSRCGMCGCDLGGSLRGRHGLPLHSLSLGLATQSNTRFLEASANGVAVHAETGSERILGLPPVIGGHNLSVRERVGGADRREVAERREISPDRPGVSDAELAHQLRDGLAGPVFSDQIVGLERKAFHGHVYNLETAGGFYVAEGILTHNCRCAIGISRIAP